MQYYIVYPAFRVMPRSGWRKTLWLSLKSETATWFSAVVIATVAALVPQITESVKLNINRADLRSQLYESMATDLSEYLFFCQLFVEFLGTGLTQKDPLDQIVADYNEAIVDLKRKELVYAVQLDRAWGKDEANNFTALLASIDHFDSVLRGLNPDIANVRSGGSYRVDPGAIKKTLPQLKSSASSIKEESRRILSSLMPLP